MGFIVGTSDWKTGFRFNTAKKRFSTPTKPVLIFFICSALYEKVQVFISRSLKVLENIKI